MRTLAILALMACNCLGEPAHVSLCDFDKGEPTTGWKFKNISVSEITTPTGRGLKIRSNKRGYIARDVTVTDWRKFDAFAMQVKVEGGPIQMRVRAMRGDNRATLLCRFTLTPGDWRPLVLPLRDWRDDTVDQVCDFSKLKTIVILWDGGKGAVSLDSIRLVPGTRGNQSCQPTHKDRLALAFPGGDGKVSEGKHFVIYTNARRLEKKRLIKRLEKGYALLKKRYRLPGEMATKAPLFVFGRRDQYVEFFVRYGKHYKIGISAPKADGYSALGIAAGVYDKQGFQRPSLLHEATHAAVYRHLYVANNVNWIQEALANAIQIEVYPKSAAGVPFKKHFKALQAGGGGFFLPLETLLTDKQITTKNYAQLASVVMFLSDEYGDKLPAFWEKVRALPDRVHKSAAPALAEALGTDLDKLQAAYVAWGVKHFR